MEGRIVIEVDCGVVYDFSGEDLEEFAPKLRESLHKALERILCSS
jgi:hypothetical protein